MPNIPQPVNKSATQPLGESSEQFHNEGQPKQQPGLPQEAQLAGIAGRRWQMAGVEEQYKDSKNLYASRNLNLRWCTVFFDRWMILN